MRKFFLLLLLSLSLTSISYGNYLDDLTDNQLCGWVDNSSPPDHIAAEAKKRGISCEGGSAIKTDKMSITNGLILESRFTRWKGKLKRWNKIIRGKQPIYKTNSGTAIKVSPLGNEQSIIINKSF